MGRDGMDGGFVLVPSTEQTIACEQIFELRVGPAVIEEGRHLLVGLWHSFPGEQLGRRSAKPKVILARQRDVDGGVVNVHRGGSQVPLKRQ